MKYPALTIALMALMLTVSTWAAEEHDHGHGNELAIDNNKNHEEEHGDEHKQEKDSHGDEHDEHGDKEGGVKLTAEQLRTGGIVVSELQPSKIHNEIRAPGEVVFNSYRSMKITPRISAQVVKRHSRLGEKVKQGQSLVTLSSVEMAEAQGELLVADREWQRVKKLGRKVVSEKRYLTAQIAFQQATARALAFGMSKSQIDIRDESSLWVEARLTPDDAHQISESAPATIHLGKMVLKGRVTQIHHTLDESTRTLAVRIEVANTDDRLHPGLFVDARIESDNSEIALNIPVNAVLRSPDGDWQVFVEEEPGHLKPKEVDVVNTVGDRVIIDGIKPGTRVVTQGAFFVQSELAKSSFEIHNH